MGGPGRRPPRLPCPEALIAILLDEQVDVEDICPGPMSGDGPNRMSGDGPVLSHQGQGGQGRLQHLLKALFKDEEGDPMSGDGPGPMSEDGRPRPPPGGDGATGAGATGAGATGAGERFQRLFMPCTSKAAWALKAA